MEARQETEPDRDSGPRDLRETLARWTEDRRWEMPPRRAAIAGLYLACLLLIWFLPGYLSPEFFVWGYRGAIPVDYGCGLYLLTAVLFGCSTALLLALVKGKTGSGARGFLPGLAVASFLLYLIPALISADLGGSMELELPFHISGWEHVGLSPVADTLLRAVICILGINLLSLATIAPYLLVERYFATKRPYATVLVLGTLLFPYLMETVFAFDLVSSAVPWISLSLSTLRVFCLGIAGAAVLCTPLAAYHLLKGSDGRQPRQAGVLGLFLVCLLLVWFVPGYFNAGPLSVVGFDPDIPPPGLKMYWFIPSGSTVQTTEGTFLRDNLFFTDPFGTPVRDEEGRIKEWLPPYDSSLIGRAVRDEEPYIKGWLSPSDAPLTGTVYHGEYTREGTEERYVVEQWWYYDERAYQNGKKAAIETLAEFGEVSEVTLDLGDHLLAAGFERREAEREYPALLFANETEKGYIIAYERPFNNGRSNDFYIVYYGTYGGVRSSDPDGPLKALITEQFFPSAIRAPGEELGEEGRLSRMPAAPTFLSISHMIAYAASLPLTAVLFGCSAALLFAGVRTALQSRRRPIVAVLSLVAVLLLLSFVSIHLIGWTSAFPPFYVHGWKHFGAPPLLDALLSLAVFLPALTLIALGVIAPYLLLGCYLPLERPVGAVFVSGLLIFPFMVLYLLGSSGGSWLWLSLLGPILAAAGAVMIYMFWAGVEQRKTSRVEGRDLPGPGSSQMQDEGPGRSPSDPKTDSAPRKNGR